MNWIHDHLPHLIGTGGAGGLLLVVFRDTITKTVEEWRADRRMAREARAAASGKDTALASAFIGLLKSDIESQAKTRDQIVAALARLSETTSQIVTMQAELDRKVNTLHGEFLTLKGAVLGRMQ